MSDDFVSRLKAERADLKCKLVRLSQFLGDIRHVISEEERYLLSVQSAAMQTYLGVLNLRIRFYLDGVERKNVK